MDLMFFFYKSSFDERGFSFIEKKKEEETYDMSYLTDMTL